MGPRSLTSGLPKSEVRLGRTAIVVVALTGLGLAWLRLPSFTDLWRTTFGIVLMIKVGLFLVMAAVAAFVTTRIDRRLREAKAAPEMPAPAAVLYEGRAYDASQSRLWKNGVHMGRHHTGQDLTEALASAPHGPEVLARLPLLGPAVPEKKDQESAVMRLFVLLAYTALVCGLLILLCVSYWKWGPPFVSREGLRWQTLKAAACLGCHRETTPALYQDWTRSFHARSRVTCLHCHQAARNDPDLSPDHARWFQAPETRYGRPEFQVLVTAVVSAKDCSRCHPVQAGQFQQSKHAHTLEIIRKTDPWLKEGRIAGIERAVGCQACHGAVVEMAGGRPLAASWPNTGIGRVNPDGSLGSCANCHARHVFSKAEARRPEACGSCHVGPDHPQMEIYRESKHGAAYEAFGREWRWDAAPGTWTAGLDFRAPTCAACHVSGAGRAVTTHDVTRRLAWELQAPLTVRPQEFQPFPADGDWRAGREEMRAVCRPCHAEPRIDGHFRALDLAVAEYDEVYYRPAAGVVNGLYRRGRLDPKSFFDEPLEVDFQELWRHEGRRARMGAAMMAPDYAWWHGFYECKKRYNRLMEEAGRLLEGK
ncbi:MAG: multiheme c-type cytochrome [Thermodesulfobacteriota bacterium]